MQFKNTAGKWLTKSLFFDLTPKIRPHAVYTFKDNDHIGGDGKEYLSLKKIFLSCNDPTEYTFATTHLGGWQHWKAMQNVEEISYHIEQWREERDVALVSIGVQKLIAQAEVGDSYQAAKYLADKGWDNQTKGRPSKEAIKKEARIAAGVKDVVSNDFNRIRNLRNG